MQAGPADPRIRTPQDNGASASSKVPGHVIAADCQYRRLVGLVWAGIGSVRGCIRYGAGCSVLYDGQLTRPRLVGADQQSETGASTAVVAGDVSSPPLRRTGEPS
jgi:hypothetical protein